MRIYNSLIRNKEEFIPLKKGRVSLYVCGPTVYDEPHIGHARSAYIFDCVRRYLLYKKFKVKFVRNVTDVDDKIIEKARSLGQGAETGLVEATREVAGRYLDAYHEDMGALGIIPPDEEPKATEYIPRMIKFIELLIKNGNAYAAGGDVYFDIRKARDYGKLSNQSAEKMEIGARISPGEKKRDGLDFALWKSAKEGEPSWPSPWGAGRPGWHIECSVMSSCLLGDEFDIHGGGIDLIFPHHENEIAQSEGAGKKFARCWMHNGLLTINGEKMAKSVGNFITIKDFLQKHADPDHLKLFFLSAHYRGPIDYTEEKITEAKKEKERFGIFLEKAKRVVGSWGRRGIGVREIEAFRARFEQAMDDDFNTPLALAALFDLVTYGNKLMHEKEGFEKGELSAIAGAAALLAELGPVLGLDLSKTRQEGGLEDSAIERLIAKRNKARHDKDFAAADDIRKELASKGVVLEDTKDGTIWRRKA